MQINCSETIKVFHCFTLRVFFFSFVYIWHSFSSIIVQAKFCHVSIIYLSNFPSTKIATFYARSNKKYCRVLKLKTNQYFISFWKGCFRNHTLKLVHKLASRKVFWDKCLNVFINFSLMCKRLESFVNKRKSHLGISKACLNDLICLSNRSGSVFILSFM